MTLSEIISRLDELPEDATIFAVQSEGHWYPHSLAFLTEEEQDEQYQVFAGVKMRYMLEIFLAREVIEAYQEHYHTLTPTDEEKLKAIIYYAEHDCYLPPVGDTRYEVRNTPAA